MTPDMSATLMIAGMTAAIAIAVIILLLFGRRGGARLPVVPKPVLTRAEIAFYHRLVRVASRIDGIDIFPQVSMGAVMDAARGIDQSTRRAVRNRFDRKIIDFVVVDSDTNVLLIIELDDSTHDTLRDRDRDSITRSAGYDTMRIRGRASRDDGEIDRALRQHLLKNHPERWFTAS